MVAAGPKRVMIAGAPASGKGTQCELIVEKYGLLHISAGDLLRAAVKEGTPAGLEAKEYMDRGDLVPDSCVVSMVVDALDTPTRRRGLAPRRVPSQRLSGGRHRQGGHRGPTPSSSLTSPTRC